ncbi:alpha-soluble NSF attachment protein-like [Ziziphus jujuba]|uniref:Alpha-soluble NSF attachment protein-like n=1 Tax=Ziziphus jujuba TaxID=326968 RepID=A0A6P6GM37_ZIZJJ|nr:alpha-soluble NSF attachment protein-like [Ziziphus jujuba]
MAQHITKGEEFEKKAEKKINGWGLFGSKYEDAAELYAKSANQFKLAKSWDRAASVFIKLSNCYLKVDSKHEAASAYIDAANCYKKTSTQGAISCLDKAVNYFLDNGRDTMAAKYCKEIGELYEQEQNIEKSSSYFERAAELFENGGQGATAANQCKLKVAQFSAQREQYQKAIQIYEEIAQQSLNNNLLKYGVRGHLLNAGLCQLCRGDVVAITNSLEKYQDLDPTFSRTREYKFLADLASAIDEEDVAKFSGIAKEFDSISPLDSWKTTLLVKVKEALKAKELEDDDLI